MSRMVKLYRVFDRKRQYDISDRVYINIDKILYIEDTVKSERGSIIVMESGKVLHVYEELEKLVPMLDIIDIKGE